MNTNTTWHTEIAELRAAAAALQPSTGAARRVVLRQARDPHARALREAYHRSLATTSAAPMKKAPPQP